MTKLRKILLTIIIILGILLVKQEVFAVEFKDKLEFLFTRQNEIDLGGETEQSQFIFCRSKGRSLGGYDSDNYKIFEKKGEKRSLSPRLARAIYSVTGGENNLNKLSQAKRAAIQWMLWLQSEQGANQYPNCFINGTNAEGNNKYISKNENLTDNVSCMNGLTITEGNITYSPFEYAKHVLKNTPKNTNNTDYDGMTLKKSGNEIEDDLKMKEDGDYYTQKFQIVYKATENRDLSYISSISVKLTNVDEVELYFKEKDSADQSFDDSAETHLRKIVRETAASNGNMDADGWVKITKRQDNDNPLKNVLNKNYTQLIIKVPKSAVPDLSNASIKIKVEHAFKINASGTSEDYYKGYYQLYKNPKGGQHAVSIDVSKGHADTNYEDDTVNLTFKPVGKGNYVKYLYGVYQNGVYSIAPDGNLLAQYDTNGKWIGGYGLIGYCTTPQWDSETGECINLEELAQPKYINGGMIGQEVSFDANVKNNEYIFVYKIQFYNSSGVNVSISQIIADYNTSVGCASYGTQLVDKYTNQSLALAYINRCDAGHSIATVQDVGIDATTTHTTTTTQWRDVQKDANGNIYHPDVVTVSGTVAWLETTRTNNNNITSGIPSDEFAYIFYYTPENGVRDAVNVSSNPVWIKSKMSIGGEIFQDELNTVVDKTTEAANGKKDSNERWTGDNVKIELYGWSSSYEKADDANMAGAVTKFATIEKDGNYTFTDLPTNDFDITNVPPNYNGYDDIQTLMARKRNYIVRFVYNGEKYESTKFDDSGQNDGDMTISRATESVNSDEKRNFSAIDRTSFNNNMVIDRTSPSANNKANENIQNWLDTSSANYLIDATTGRTKDHYITVDSPYKNNVNLGLIKRYFDLNLTNSLESMDISINGVTQRVTGNGILESTVNVSDINQEFAFKSSDYNYAGNNQLEVWVNYKVTINNESANYIGQVNTLNIFYDKRFDAIKINQTETANQNKASYNVSDFGKATVSNIMVGNGSSTSVNVHLKLNRQTIYDIFTLQDTDILRTLEFIAEIGEYTSFYHPEAYDKSHPQSPLQYAGKLDEDSIAGNFSLDNYKKYVRGTTNVSALLQFFNSEDDFSRALGVKLVKDTSERKITGIVFEDTALPGYAADDKDKAGKEIFEGRDTRFGDGTYTRYDEAIKITDIKLVDFTDEKNPVSRGTLTFDEDTKKYTISGFIPSKNYKVQFTYGDGTTGYYNAQDYKSTIDTTGIQYTQPTLETIIENGKTFYAAPNGTQHYWYANESIKDKSVAKDIYMKMTEETLTNATAVAFEDGTDDGLKNTAQTASLYVPIRYLGNRNSGKDEYNIKNINFGLAERPRSELTIEKVVEHVTVTATDGTTLINGNEQGAKSISWTERYVQPIIDENLIYGSKLTITYKIIVKNTGEVDYDSPSFYYFGIIGNGKVITTTADKVIDYTDNNLTYDPEDLAAPNVSKSLKNKTYWRGFTEENLLDENAKKYKGSVTTTLVTNIFEQEKLKPGEETSPAYLTQSKIMSSNEVEDPFTYNNYVEIVQSTNSAGRRSYSTENDNLLSEYDDYRGVPDSSDNSQDKRISDKKYILSIPGNLNPNNLYAISNPEPDSDNAQEIQVIQPFGSTIPQKIIIWTSLGIISGIILAGGIYVIKKKVLTK